MAQYLCTLFLLLLNTLFLYAQTEGVSATCPENSPVLAEVMVDACGNEFQSEYVVVRTQTREFDARQYQLRVTNPANNAFVGSISVAQNTVNQGIINMLNQQGVSDCVYGITFRDAFAFPYNGVIPPNSAVLIFNNKDSTDISYLNRKALSALCGSKVFVVFGTLKPQSPLQPIFRNFPPNNSCGASGCLRQISLATDNGSFCQSVIYDIKKVAHPNVNDPNAAFLGGGYIRPTIAGLTYGSDNVSSTSGCMPTKTMLCSIPRQPGLGNGFWNISAFDGLNDFSDTSFKGFYQAKDPVLGISNIEFYTLRQGWKPYEKPSEAHPNLGAMTAYNGCEVKADSFSYVAKREGFPCGDYALELEKYDDFLNIKIDEAGDGIYEYDTSFSPPACSSGCKKEIWRGNLTFRSRVEIRSYDTRGEAVVKMVFNKKNTSPLLLSLTGSTLPSLSALASGALNLKIGGGTPPFNIRWTGPTSVSDNTLNANNLTSGTYSVTVTDAANCRDSARFQVAQINVLVVNAGNDTTFCAGGTAQLRGSATGGTGTYTYEWSTTSGQFVSNQQNTTVSPSVTTSYVLKVTDSANATSTDTIKINVNPLPIVEFETYVNNRLGSLTCNDTNFVLKPKGAVQYCWSGFPRIIESAFSVPFPHCQNSEDSMVIFSLFLPKPDPTYAITLTGTDANGCVNTYTNPAVVIKPLPRVQLLPFAKDTFCKSEAPFALMAISETPNVRFEANFIDPITQSLRPCANCIVDSTFFPQRAAPGSYVVSAVAQDNFNCKNAPSRILTVKECDCPNPAFADAGNDTTLCEQQFIQLRGVIRNVNQAYWITNGSGAFSDISDLNAIYNFSSDDFRKGKVTISLVTEDPDGFFQSCSSAEDSIVIKLSKSAQTIVNQTICQGDSFRFDGMYLKTAGTFYDTIKISGKCDSIVVLNLSLKRPAVVDAPPILTCVPSENGKIDTVRFGCDSLVLYRHVYQTRPTTMIKRVICEGDTVRFNNKIYNQTGRDSVILRTRSGCDSVVILDLTVRVPTETFVDAVTCLPQKVGIQETGRVKFFNSNCDSLITYTDFRLDTTGGIDAILNITKPVSCHNSNDGSIAIGDIMGGTAQYSFRWNTGDTTRQIRNLKGGSYAVTLTDKEGCKAVKNIELSEPPPLSINAEIVPPRCYGDVFGSVRINSISGNNAPFSIKLGSFNTQSVSNFPLKYDSLRVGNYNVKITDQAGCSSDSLIRITEPNLLKLSFTKSINLVLGDSSIVDIRAPFNIQSIKWQPSEGVLCDSCTSTIVAPKASTTFKITVKDDKGCVVQDELFVSVTNQRRIYAPNVFNPNDPNEVNKKFMLYGDASVTIFKSMQIFNRWGNLVYAVKDFQSGDLSKGWDGTWRGQALAPDVFVYFVVVEYIDGRQEVITGDIMLKK